MLSGCVSNPWAPPAKEASEELTSLLDKLPEPSKNEDKSKTPASSTALPTTPPVQSSGIQPLPSLETTSSAEAIAPPPSLPLEGSASGPSPTAAQDVGQWIEEGNADPNMPVWIPRVGPNGSYATPSGSTMLGTSSPDPHANFPSNTYRVSPEIRPNEFVVSVEEIRELTLLERLVRDQQNFYSPESLAVIGGAFGIGAIMANTSIDQTLDNHARSSVNSASSDEWYESLHANKELGNGVYTLPVFAIAWGVGSLAPEGTAIHTTGDWGQKSLRGFVVGAPPLILLQNLVGGSRPGEAGDHSSYWTPFDDNNGVSGHAFMGSLPFITAAKMTDRPLLKVVFYAGSTLAPLSRVSDGAHFPSQVFLGWVLAYAAATAVDVTDRPDRAWHFVPYADFNNVGFGFERRW